MKTGSINPGQQPRPLTGTGQLHRLAGNNGWGLMTAFTAVVTTALMAGHTGNRLWASPDFWVHLAAVREFALSGRCAGSPLIAGLRPDPYLSPYTLILGMTAYVTAVHPVTILAAAGLFNLLFLGLGLSRFIGSFKTQPGAVFFLFAATLLAWGFHPWRWSGFFNLNALGYTLPLGSTFASAAALFMLAAAVRHRYGDKSLIHPVTVFGFAPVVILVHPMTAAWALPMTVTIIISSGWEGGKDKLIFLLLLGAGSGLCLLWPFFPVTGLWSGAAAFDPANMTMFDRLVQRTFLAWPGLIILAWRWRNNRRDPLANAAGSVIIIYLFAWFTGRASFARVLPAIILGAHTAMALELAHWWHRTGGLRQRKVLLTAVILVMIIGGIGTAPGAIRGIPRSLMPARLARDPRLHSVIDPYLEILPGPIERQDLVVATPGVSLPVAALSGQVIAPPAPLPFISPAEIARREQLVAHLLEENIEWPERRQRLTVAGARWLALAPEEMERLSITRAEVKADTVVKSTALIIIRIDHYGSENEVTIEVPASSRGD